MRRVVFNRKSGVGKSIIVCNLAAVSAASGRRRLVVDLDPQANSTRHLPGDRGLGSGARDHAWCTLGVPPRRWRRIDRRRSYGILQLVRYERG
jgi:hypothetical protein